MTINRRLVEGAIVGLIAGVLAGMFGVGGGIIMVPLYVLWLKVNQHLAHGTSLAAVMPIAASGAISYNLAGQVDWSAVWLVLIGAVVGARIGVHILHRTEVHVLQRAFAVLLIITSVRLLMSAQPHQLFDGVLSQVLLVFIGLLAGMMAGLLGVGGGIVIVPALMLTVGHDPALARGTSLAVIVGTGISGTLAHRKKKNIDYSLAIASGAVGVPAAVLGTWISQHTPERVTVLLFAVLLLSTAMQLVKKSSR